MAEGVAAVFCLCVLVVVLGAQPRSSTFIMLDKIQAPQQGEPQYAKLLQPPLAFSYTQAQDSNHAESVIKHRLYRPNEPTPTPVVRRLTSKRILMPKKYFPEPINQDEEEIPRRESDFLIYVPDAIIIEPEPQEHLKQVSDDVTVDKDAEEVAEASSEVRNLPKADQHVQESHHKKHKPKPKPVNTKYEAGGEKTDKDEHHETSKKEGDKVYKAEHVKHKVEKSHHAEKDKSGHYADKGGDEKKFDKGEEYQAGQHEEDGGQKGTKYEEEGEHDKGHGTKGSHNIRKKDEYVKKIEFFDEYHEDSDEDEDGGHEDEKDFKKAHHDHKEHHDSADKHDYYDDHKDHEDSSEKKYQKGKHDAAGHDSHHDHDNKHDKKSNHDSESKKIWKIVVTDKKSR